jgi:hypothetical protein
LNAHPVLGWYISPPTDLKKQRPTLRWVTVSDYWLLISAKPTEPPLFSVLLGFCDFWPALPNEPFSVNRLLVTTQSFLGTFPCDPLFLSTHNRFDILDLNEALVQGKGVWQQVLSAGLPQTTFPPTSFKDKKSGLLGGKNVECSLSADGFKTVRSATKIINCELSQVTLVRPLPFDSRGVCFELIVRSGAKPEMLFQCHDNTQMRQFVTLFLYLLSRRSSEQIIDL